MTTPLTPQVNAQVAKTTALGQSLWYDNIRRSFLAPGGEMYEFIHDGVIVGVTSNPSIFEKAIAASSDYDTDFAALVKQGADADAIYLALVKEDIGKTADLLRPIYDRTKAADGFVSIEVSPHLAHDTEDTVKEALHLSAVLNRPNIMVKVPGTPAGVPAIRALTQAGLSINVTLLFSLSQYEAIARAYIDGIEARVAAGEPVSHIASVASFFVSRVDSLVDKRLSKEHPALESSLRGKAAIANAKLAFELGKSLFSGERWEKLAAAGARPQRLLWASTSTKDPRYPDTLYLDELIGPNTVNTVPPATLKAYLDHGKPRASLTEGLAEAKALVAQLKTLGIDLEQVGQVLQEEGVASFAASMTTLMQAIVARRQAALG